MTKGIAQHKVRKVGRGKIIMSFVDHSKKLRFHPVGRDLKQGYKLHFKENTLEETRDRKVTAMVQTTGDESNDKEEGEKERRHSRT